MHKSIKLLLAFLLGFSPFRVASDSASGKDEAISIQSEQPVDKKNYRPLFLQDAVGQAMEKNFEQKNRKHARDMLKINWSDIQEDFWVPRMSLQLESSPQRLFKLRSGGKDPSNGTPSAPNGRLSFRLGEYTLFNWGKDYIEYLNKREDLHLKDRVLGEKERHLSHQVIIQYADMEMFQAIEKALREQLRQASFLYRHDRGKARIKKIPAKNYYMARMEYLRAQSEYREGLGRVQAGDAAMAALIADPPETRYVLRNTIKFQKLKLSLNEGLKLVERTNFQITRAQAHLKKSQRSQVLTNRENLPLPKITLDLGAYTHTFGERVHTTRYETRPGNSDWEVVARINASWAITGENGFLNSRKTKQVHLEEQSAYNSLAEAKHWAKVRVEALYRDIKNTENRIAILKSRNANIRKTFDLVLENYLNRQARFTELRQVFVERTLTAIKFAQAKAEHFKAKVRLASHIGIDSLPGEIFERQVETKDKKL